MTRNSFRSNKPFFDRFTSSEAILPFGEQAPPLPTADLSYNDDVSIPHYEEASRISRRNDEVESMMSPPKDLRLTPTLNYPFNFPAF